MSYKTCHCVSTVKWLLTNVWLTINVPFMNDYYVSPTCWKSVHLWSCFSSRNAKHLSLLGVSNMRICSSNHSKLNMFEFWDCLCFSMWSLFYLQMNSLCVDNDSSSISDTGVTVVFHRSHIHKYLFLFWTNNNNVNCTFMRLLTDIARLKVVMIMFLFSWEEKHEGPQNIQRAREWQGERVCDGGHRYSVMMRGTSWFDEWLSCHALQRAEGNHSGRRLISEQDTRRQDDRVP